MSPERRVHDGRSERRGPYSRPSNQRLYPPVAPQIPALDLATQAAIQAAAAAAAAAAMAHQQRQQALHGAQQASNVPALPPGMPNFVKVSGTSDPRKVAGKLAHTVRDNPAPAMLTIGANCINQAVKAICIARARSNNLNLLMPPKHLLGSPSHSPLLICM
eukprot:GHRR01020363.1.p1 GENE.GHRR01020363.1~~GHRR01020363.1.p1  ORF type:complete len:161 (+),score=21.23 GHRR01020363.1:249-731(+)